MGIVRYANNADRIASVFGLVRRAELVVVKFCSKVAEAIHVSDSASGSR